MTRDRGHSDGLTSRVLKTVSRIGSKVGTQTKGRPEGVSWGSPERFRERLEYKQDEF